jgi:hypothetical protein
MGDTPNETHIARIDQLLEMLARQKAEFERLAASANDAAMLRGQRQTDRPIQR